MDNDGRDLAKRKSHITYIDSFFFYDISIVRFFVSSITEL